MKKLLLVMLMIILIACLFVGCNTAPPTDGDGDGDDGDDGDEEVSRVVLVEVFTQSACANCAIIEPIIEQLADEYVRSEVIFVEERAYGTYALPEITNRYEWYLPSSADRGTPNTLFNGFNSTYIHGTASKIAIKLRVNMELNKKANISISASRSNNSTVTTISGTIKNIGSSILDNLVINGMIFKDRGQTGLKYSVTDILEEQKETVATLEPGNTHNFSFTLEDANWVINGLHGVIFVQDTDSLKKEILQALYVE